MSPPPTLTEGMAWLPQFCWGTHTRKAEREGGGLFLIGTVFAPRLCGYVRSGGEREERSKSEEEEHFALFCPV